MAMPRPVLIDQPDPETLWGLPPHVFNEWRATHDLPVLFADFAQRLTGFCDWVDTLPFTKDVLLRVVPTGDLFKGEGIKTVIKSDDGVPGLDRYVCIDAAAATAVWAGRPVPKEAVIGEFLPYFAWAHRRFGDARFFVTNAANKTKSSTFEFGSWTGLPRTQGGDGRRASLFDNLYVLKLGEITLQGTVMGWRNLDFADLDFLTMTGMFGGGVWKEISFSSCKELAFLDAETAFFKFYGCAMDTIRIDRSRVQDLRINSIASYYHIRIAMSDSMVHGLRVERSRFTPVVKDCELRELCFVPAEDIPPGAIATTYRMLRATFQAAGQRQEASNCYFLERLYERKALWQPYAEFSDDYPGMMYRGLFAEARRAFDKGHLNRDELRWVKREIVKARLKLLIPGRPLLRLLRSKARWLASLFDAMVWGYGERPSRIIVCIVTAILGYAGVYHWLPWPGSSNVPKGWLDDLYFSTVTFTTLGYGDILPATGLLKVISASEALIGGLSLGLVVAGFSNRSRY